MKVVILAGGYGTRISEETDSKPKPMVEIGGRPIIWHIMKSYAQQGFNEFVILLGYKGYSIKEYFSNYFLHQSDVTLFTAQDKFEVHNTSQNEDWKVTLVETGLNTMTGSRIKRAERYIKDEPFLLTYGDGLSDVCVKDLVEFHNASKALITLTSVQPEGRFGSLDIGSNGAVNSFLEKPKGDGYWINGGFFVVDPSFLDLIKNENDVVLEREPLETAVSEGRLAAFKHHGFWKCMDTLRDKNYLENLWNIGQAPWKIW